MKTYEDFLEEQEKALWDALKNKKTKKWSF